MKYILHITVYHLTNGYIDILNGCPCPTSSSFTRLTQEPCERVLIGQIVGDGTGPCVLTS